MNYLMLLMMLFATPAFAEDKSKDQQTIPEFKGMCFQLKGKLAYENGTWVCKGSKVNNLEPIDLYHNSYNIDNKK